MPINTKYDGYDAAMKKVKRVRDFAAGEDAVKAAGEEYLPRLSGQKKDKYDAMKQRGFFIPAVKPTATGIIGSVMRKDATVGNSSIDYVKKDIDGMETDIDQFASDMMLELLLAGGVGYLIEHDGNNAFAKLYQRENIINYSDNFIVLAQKYDYVNPKDKFEIESRTEYLELTFDENGNYIQNLWRQGKGKDWVIVDTVMPTNRGSALNYIPFVYVAPSRVGFRNDDDPLLLHLANVNWNHYMLSTDQRHGLHASAQPTLFVKGDLEKSNGGKAKITVGPGSYVQLEDTEADMKWVEFTGAGLGSIKIELNDLVEIMASIGAKMLTGSEGGVKAAETARIEASSETAMLSTLANSVDLAMAKILMYIADWMGGNAPEYSVNRDFIDVKLDPQALTALLQTWQSGGMSLNSFLYQLQRGELLPPGVTPEDEEDRIDQGGGSTLNLDL